jgi:hypothetical protein
VLPSKSEVVARHWTEYCEYRYDSVSPAYTEYWLVQIRTFVKEETKYVMKDMKRIRMRKSEIRNSEETENKENEGEVK